VLARLTSLALILLALMSAAASAQQGGAATVYLDGRPLFRVGPDAETPYADDRARRIEERLQTLLQDPDHIGPTVVQPHGATERTISSAKAPIVTVTERDAEDHLVSLDELAAQWASTIESELEQAHERRLSAEGRFVTNATASARAALGRFLDAAILIVPRALAALLMVFAFWGVAVLVRWTVHAVFRHTALDRTVESLVKQLTYYAVIAIGLIVAADVLGFSPQTIIAGLGLTGLAVGFAIRDVISNFVSGILILWLRPFEIGDQIVVGATEGTVERIELRATRIGTYDGRVAVVPNAELFNSTIINNTAHLFRRGAIVLHLGYETDLRRAAETIAQAVRTAANVLPDPPSAVRIVELGANDLSLEATFWTDSRALSFVNADTAVRHAIVDALRRAEIRLPSPEARRIEIYDAATASALRSRK
jgi:small conductance mechanosensitive channel